eukprot:421272-Amphidinium_carterae.1
MWTHLGIVFNLLACSKESSPFELGFTVPVGQPPGGDRRQVGHARLIHYRGRSIQCAALKSPTTHTPQELLHFRMQLLAMLLRLLRRFADLCEWQQDSNITHDQRGMQQVDMCIIHP